MYDNNYTFQNDTYSMDTKVLLTDYFNLKLYSFMCWVCEKVSGHLLKVKFIKMSNNK